MTDRYDLSLLAAWLLLLTIGAVMIASASIAMTSSNLYFFTKHSVFLVLGVGVFALVSAVPLKAWDFLHRVCLFTALLLCAAVLIPVIGVEVNGSRRWINLGFFTLQAAEVAKFLVVIYLAGYLARTASSLRDDVFELLRPLAWIGVLLVLVLLQPDFGSTVVLALLAGGLLFLAGARLKHFAVIAVVGCAGLVALAFLQPYRVARMTGFRAPWDEPFGSGYQLTQALIAFGRGEVFGLGLGDGVQKLFYLPEAHNDFIFAVIAEELGVLGAVAIFSLLLYVVLRVFRIARRAATEGRLFGAYAAYGVALLLGTQVLINVGVNTGVLPTKGLTLPFISFGGNSVLVCCALLGLAFRVSMEAHRGNR